MSQTPQTPGRSGPRASHALAYKRRFGSVPFWLKELSEADALWLQTVALRVGMRLAKIDYHLLEDSARPELKSWRAKPKPSR